MTNSENRSCHGSATVSCPRPKVTSFNHASKLSNGFDSWPKLNSATASILGQSATASIPGQSVISESANCSILSQSAISESATVHYFSLVRQSAMSESATVSPLFEL
ncbi:unnamed protein product [Rodentolepis nana]|uniref:Uncharacterized protein n=1 Tax=Rodentolepis nana TaxID=102285 RepID=A0A0R3TGU5_RODNA|nr:unnamed protein product [Rodentolepis nana]